MSNVKNKRAPKTTNNQLDIILNHITLNRDLLIGKANDEVWSSLIDLLHSVRGSKKTKREWKRFIIQWKSKTKKKARDFKKSLTDTGGGSNQFAGLNSYEKRLMGLVGWNSLGSCKHEPGEIVSVSADSEDMPIVEEYLAGNTDESFSPEAESTSIDETNLESNDVEEDSIIDNARSSKNNKVKNKTQYSMADIYNSANKDLCGAIKELARAIVLLAENLKK